MTNVTPLRHWRETPDGFQYVSGKTVLGHVVTTDFGTVCWVGNGIRGTAERVDLAKLCVEDLFKTDGEMAKLMKFCREEIARRKAEENESKT